MFNKVILVGYLTRNIEMRYANNGIGVGNTGIAVNRKFTDGSGVKREEVLFIDIAFFGKTAEVANQYLKKGSKLLVEGRLKFDTWQDNHAQTRSKHSIVVENMKMLGENSQNSQNYSGSKAYNHNNQPPVDSWNQNDSHNVYSKNIQEIDIDEDELPF